MNELPTNPHGYDRTETAAGNVKYLSPDRRAVIICKRVTTHGGEIWSCTLYESEHRYEYGTRITSEAAPTVSDVHDAIRTLHNERTTHD